MPLSLNRSSTVTSGTTNKSVPTMAWEQSEPSRGISVASSPNLDLNHCRFESVRLTRAMGVPQMVAASQVRSSYRDSGDESMAQNLRRASSRSASFRGTPTFA